ncbi:hypothetical protein VNO77_25705 [Canavalia gladiata]|uniref:ubiquitinyl hydrolase 1 n=1 Tax=Canavalia gladiata TaxID=3824 RepID=A0AAN9L8M4_CANGL
MEFANLTLERKSRKTKQNGKSQRTKVADSFISLNILVSNLPSTPPDFQEVMGKKVRKKSRGSAKEKGVDTHSPKKVMESSTSTVESVGEGVSVAKETNSCPHLVKGVNLNRLSSKIGSCGSIRCEDCREGAADRRSGKGKGKHGKKKGGASLDSKSESKSIWVCLVCGQYTCGGVGLPITPQCHVVGHARKNRHPLVVHFDKPQLCWCFPCNMLIQIDKIEKTDEMSHLLSDVVKLVKGRSSEKSSVDIEDVSIGDGSVTSEIKSGALIANNSYEQGGYVVRGMINLGNTCFFNSIMQNLLAMNRLRDNFLKLDAPVGPLISSLKKLLTETNPESGLKNILNPRSFFGCVCSKSPQFRGYQQHDSHELLRCLLDGLSTEELAGRKQNGSPKKDGTSSNTLVDALFGGQISSTVCCIACGHFSTVYEPFLDLSLPVPTKKPPPRKAQQVPRTKKTKLPPKKGGKTRVKVNRDTDPLPVESLSNQLSSHESSCPDQSISVAGEMGTSSGDSMVLGSEEISGVADKEGLSSPNLVTVGEYQHMQVVDNGAMKTSTSLDDCTWLDYVEAGTMINECDFISLKDDAPEVQDTESKDECFNEFPVQASGESSDPVCSLKEDKNLRPNSSANGWEDEVPLQVQDSEVLLLPYKEESSLAGNIIGKDDEASSSVLGGGQEELEFDGFGDLFTEPEVFAGPAPRPSSCSEVMETGFIIGSNSESDPDEVDDTDSPVSVESCLAHFIKPELLSDENAWHCENCSKVLQRQKLEGKKQTRNGSDGRETGSHDKACHASHSCSVKVRSIGNGDIKNDKNIESLVSCVKHGTELENGQRDEPSLIVNERELEDKQNGELPSAGVHNACNCNEESCNLSAADSCIAENVQGRDSLVLDNDDNDSEEADSKSVKVKRDATKRVLIYKAPPVLTIHLKRFSQDARGRLSKLNGHVNFKEIMDIRPYIDPRCIGEEKYVYHLVGVVEHSGSMRGGHYVAYVRGGQRSRGKGDKGNEGFTWYQASDAYVREVSLDEVLRCEAYILFYEIS